MLLPMNIGQAIEPERKYPPIADSCEKAPMSPKQSQTRKPNGLLNRFVDRQFRSPRRGDSRQPALPEGGAYDESHAEPQFTMEHLGLEAEKTLHGKILDVSFF